MRGLGLHICGGWDFGYEMLGTSEYFQFHKGKNVWKKAHDAKVAPFTKPHSM